MEIRQSAEQTHAYNPPPVKVCQANAIQQMMRIIIKYKLKSSKIQKAVEIIVLQMTKKKRPEMILLFHTNFDKLILCARDWKIKVC